MPGSCRAGQIKLVHIAAGWFALCGLTGIAASAVTKSTAKKAPVKASTGTKKPAPKTVASKSKSKSKSTKKAPAVTWRTRQTAPTVDRYREIQQALADKGYLKSEPTGVWDQSSTEAMQRFQTDQKIPATGKLTAPALIALGLGGKSAGAPEAPALQSEPQALKPAEPPGPESR